MGVYDSDGKRGTQRRHAAAYYSIVKMKNAKYAHLGHGSGNREKGLLLQQPLIHRRHVGLDMELICLALGTLRLAQAEVMVGPPVVRYASKMQQTKQKKRDEGTNDIQGTWEIPPSSTCHLTNEG